MSKMSVFSCVKNAPPIEIFALVKEYTDDDNPKKVNLSVGAYRNDEGKPWVLPVVRKVEAQMAGDESLNHEYLPVAGLPLFREEASKLLLGKDSSVLTENRVECIQSQGGTGALRLAAEFLKKCLGMDTAYVSVPTWGNHNGVFKAAGFSTIKQYRYWDAEKKGLNLEGMIEDFSNAEKGSVVILHGCAHNPTGCDPTLEQWAAIADVCQKKELFVVMDCAYQGFATGDLDGDSQAARFFAERGFEFFIAQSFSKNFGLYNERIGNLCCVLKTAGEAKQAIHSQLELIVRQMWSNPSNHGARIVASILSNNDLCSQWKKELKTMADRILLMRDSLKTQLKLNGTPGNWDHITSQKGMFSFTGLNPSQCEILKKKYHIYLMKTGRINMCGLTSSNLDYVAKAIHTVVTTESANL